MRRHIASPHRIACNSLRLPQRVYPPPSVIVSSCPIHIRSTEIDSCESHLVPPLICTQALIRSSVFCAYEGEWVCVCAHDGLLRVIRDGVTVCCVGGGTDRIDEGSGEWSDRIDGAAHQAWSGGQCEGHGSFSAVRCCSLSFRCLSLLGYACYTLLHNPLPFFVCGSSSLQTGFHCFPMPPLLLLPWMYCIGGGWPSVA